MRGGQPPCDTIGVNHAALRRPDPRIAARIRAAPGDARTVLHVGAGAWARCHANLLAMDARVCGDRLVVAGQPREPQLNQTK